MTLQHACEPFSKAFPFVYRVFGVTRAALRFVNGDTIRRFKQMLEVLKWNIYCQGYVYLLMVKGLLLAIHGCVLLRPATMGMP